MKGKKMTVFLTFDLCTKSMITIFLKSDFYITWQLKNL